MDFEKKSQRKRKRRKQANGQKRRERERENLWARWLGIGEKDGGMDRPIDGPTRDSDIDPGQDPGRSGLV